MAEGMRFTPRIACTTSSRRSRSTCAKRRPPVSTAANNASTTSTTGIWLGGAPVRQRLRQHLTDPAPLQVPHHRYQPTPAADRFARVTHFQAGRRPAKSATLPLHRPVPPPGLSSSLTTQRYQTSSSGRCASHSLKLIFLG